MTTSLSKRNHGQAWTSILLESGPSLALVGLLVVYPLACLLLQVVLPHLFDVHRSLALSLEPLLGVFQDKMNLVAVGNSVLVGALAALVATVFGTITAFGSWRASGRWKTAVDLGVWVVFFTPSYIAAEGWILLMQDGGILAQAFHLPMGWSAWFFSRFGVAIAMGFRYLPFVHLAMVQALVNVGAELSDAARLLGADRATVVRRIIFPLLTPAWLAGATIAFAEGFSDFGFAAAIAPSIRLPMVTYQIYAALNQAPVNYPAAAGLSLLVILVTAAALWLQFWWMRRKAYTTISSSSRPVVTGKADGKAGAVPGITLAGLGLSLVPIILPVGAIVCASLWKNWTDGMAPQNWTFQAYAQALRMGGQGVAALDRSFVYALVAAVCTMVLGVLIAYQLTFHRSALTRVLNVLIMSTMAIPGVVLAAGFVFAWNATWLIPLHLVLYGTSICLGMAYIAGSLPYAVRLQMGAMTQLSPSLLVSARVAGAGTWTLLWRIVLPLVGATAVNTFFMTFTGTIFELPASSLLYPPGEPPFPVIIDSKFNAFEWSLGSALTIVGMVVLLLAYLLGQYLMRRLQETGNEYGRNIATQRQQELW